MEDQHFVCHVCREFFKQKIFDSHIQEHMKAMAKDDDDKVPELSEQDMIYYLFVIHDTNGDGYLDGHELRAAFTDFDEDEIQDLDLTLQEVTDMVDHVLLEDDKNGE